MTSLLICFLVSQFLQTCNREEASSLWTRLHTRISWHNACHSISSHLGIMPLSPFDEGLPCGRLFSQHFMGFVFLVSVSSPKNSWVPTSALLSSPIQGRKGKHRVSTACLKPHLKEERLLSLQPGSIKVTFHYSKASDLRWHPCMSFLQALGLKNKNVYFQRITNWSTGIEGEEQCWFV